MRPQRRLHLTRRSLGRRKAIVCITITAVLLLIILVGSFSGRGGSSKESEQPNAPTNGTAPAAKRTQYIEAHIQFGVTSIGDAPPFGLSESDLTDKHLRSNNTEDIDLFILTPNVLMTMSKEDEIAMVFFIPPFHDRTAASVATHGGSPSGTWEGLTMPNDPLSIPHFATPNEAAVLTSASIFVSLASYRDPECLDTLAALFDSAASPYRIYVGVSEERTADDTNCLRFFDERSDADLVKRLWGSKASELRNRESLLFRKDGMRWTDLLNSGPAPVPVMKTEDAIAAQKAGTLTRTAAPDFVFLLPDYEDDTISCIGGRHERMRDQYILELSHGTRSGRTPLMRRGKGGAQQTPFAALAGCRVTRRLASPKMARGPTFGRYVTSLFYANQDYYMVIDSHSRFSVTWDMKMIRRVFQNPSPGILSHYPNGYTPEKPTAEYTKRDVMIMCRGQVLANAMPKLGAMWMPVRSYNVLQAFAAAGYMFGDAQFALDAPFDPFLPYLFDGEEILYSGRLWTTGWDIYGPGEPNIFHHYGRPKTPKFWEHVKANEAALRKQSERRALYLLRRSQPWVQVLEDAEREYNNTVRAKQTASKLAHGETVPPFTPPPHVASEQRPVVTDAEAAANPSLSILANYYGMGAKRTLTAYWEYCQMGDDKIVERDNEHRWKSGEGLCNDAMKPRV